MIKYYQAHSIADICSYVANIRCDDKFDIMKGEMGEKV